MRCTGKGRKTRCVPLRKDTVAVLRAWLEERRGEPSEVLFPNARGHAMSRDGVEYLLAKHLVTARKMCPSLKTKRVSAHVLRHTLAMNLLQTGVDRSVIALWLGHEQMDTTQVCLHADLKLKEQALAKTEPFVGAIPALSTTRTTIELSAKPLIMPSLQDQKRPISSASEPFSLAARH